MKTYPYILTISFLFLSVLGRADTLTAYTYDSLLGKGSLGALVSQEFKKRYPQHELKWVGFSSAGEALNQVAIEGNSTPADAVVGIDPGLLIRARALAVFDSVPRQSFSQIPDEFFFDTKYQVIPFDYGYLAVLYDESRTKVPAGLKFSDLATHAVFKKKLVVEDARTSSLGFGFLIWGQTVMKEKSAEFWEGFSKQVLTVSPGWSGAYNLFLKKEADFVLSYTTSPAYHIENEKKESIKSIIFPEGHYQQIEGAGVIKYTKHRALAESLLGILTSEEVQKQLPKLQWMYPVRKNTELPASFKKLPVPKTLNWEIADVETKKKAWLKDWESALSGKTKGK